MNQEMKTNVVKSLKVGGAFAVLLHAILSLTINVGVPVGEQITNLLCDIVILSAVEYVLLTVKRETYKELVRPSLIIGVAASAIVFEIWLVKSGILNPLFWLFSGEPIGQAVSQFAFLVQSLALPRLAWSIADVALFGVIAFALLSAELYWDRRHTSVEQAQ